MDLDDPFDRYKKEVASLYANGGSVSWAQKFEAAPPELHTPANIATALLGAVTPGPWAQVYKEVASNWAWRPRHLPTADEDGEVWLERKIVETALDAGLDSWTFQMPTMSGVTGPRRHKRRSVDLVHRVADGHYELIELKTTSNDPAYAAFEILFYGLAYCRARQHVRLPVDDQHRILDARRIDLVVLAPRPWYAHKAPSGTFAVPYALNRLTIVLNEVLSVATRQLNLDGLELSFGFKVFEGNEQLLADVAAGRAAGREYARGRD